MTSHRSVVEEARFVDELAAIDPDVRRTDEALFYVKDVLARDPEVGIRTPVPGVWIAPIFLPTARGTGARPASIFYTVTETAVHLLSITLG